MGGRTGRWILAGLAAAAIGGGAATEARRGADVPAPAPSIRAALSRLPLRFEENRGQAGASVRYVHRARGYVLGLGADGAVLDCAGPSGRALLRWRPAGGAPDAAVTGESPLPGRTHHLRGRDPSRWAVGAAGFARVRCAGVYPGVDLVYHGAEGVLEYDFVVAPGADPGVIAMEIEGAASMDVDARGDLVLGTAAGEVRQRRPVLYQEVADARREVEGRFSLRGGGKVGFEVGAYDRGRPLVIDPTVVFAGLLGGDSQDLPYAVAFGPDGGVYVAGDTYSSDLAAGSPFEATFQGSTGNSYGTAYQSGDAFVSKLSPDGTSVVWTTYLGGASDDMAFGVAVDPSGGVYVTGRTMSGDFPVTDGALDETHDLEIDAFVAKLAPDGASLEYCTFLGGNNRDEGFGIAVGAAGEACVVGSTWSSTFPLASAHQAVKDGYNSVFLSRLNAAGDGLVFSTFLGGNGNADQGIRIALDPAGNILVAGQTSSTDFPLKDALQGSMGSAYDAFVAKFSAAGVLAWSTYLGGDAWDVVYGLAVDPAGDAYVCGSTWSSNFPTTAGAWDETTANPGNGGNSFVAKILADGSALGWATYLEDGNGYEDLATGIGVDASGAAYVVGRSRSALFPQVNGLQGWTDGATYQNYVAKIAPSGASLVYSTYLGGTESVAFQVANLFADAIAVDAAGVAVVVGSTAAADFPVTAGAFETDAPPGANAFVAMIHPLTAPVAPTGLAASAPSASSVEVTWTDESDEESGFQVERSVEGGAFSLLATLSADAESYVDDERDPLRTYAYRVRAVNDAGVSPFAGPEGATTPATLALVAIKGKLGDVEDAGRDRFQVKGTIGFGAYAEDQDCDFVADGLEITFGDPADPVAFSIPAASPLWKVKGTKATWKSAKGAVPSVKVVLDIGKGTFQVKAKGLDFPATPADDVRVVLRCGNDAGATQAAWTPNPRKPGALKLVP
jgi:hypothetical protein